jgi:hypothetical protein
VPLPALGDDGFLSLGGEVRLRYDYDESPAWGQDPQDPHGGFLQRYLLHADLHLGERVRVFTQLRSALEDGRAGPPSPIEKGELEMQQAFADVGVLEGGALTLRMGRQELSLGSERLVSVREGPTIRRRFDGLRGIVHAEGWDVSALALYPAQNEPGVFEDDTDTDQSLFGLYAVSPELGLPGMRWDLYYLGYRNEHAAYAQGAGKEKRHSLGVRAWGRHADWDWNGEGIVQVGRFDGADLMAWTVATDTGYTISDASWAPRLGVSANVASGDRDRGDRDLETFNPLFPRGTYFDALGLLGPRNFVNLHPSVTAAPRPDVTLIADVDFFWRLSRDDGVYDPAGNLLRDGTGSKERYVSTLISAEADWQATEHFLFTVVYTHVVPGEFIRETGPHAQTDFIELTARVLF